MSVTTVDLTTVQPFERRAAVEFGRVEYRRFVEELESLGPDDWNRPTECPPWTVRDMAGHLAGSMQTQTSIRRLMSEQRAVKQRRKHTGEREVDAMTSVQIESVADLTPTQLVERMRSLINPAADGRRRVPRAMCKLVTFPVDLGTIKEKWNLGYLIGTILTRDTWLHRVSDLARAIEREPTLDQGHDALIVADVAAEWARRHAQPVELILTGPAGGRFMHRAAGADAARIELDAIEFCRILSERAEPTHALLTLPVPF